MIGLHLFLNGLSAVSDKQCTVSDRNCHLVLYWEYPDEYRPQVNALTKVERINTDLVHKGGVEAMPESDKSSDFLSFQVPIRFRPILEILKRSYQLADDVNATNQSEIKLNYKNLIEELHLDIQLGSSDHIKGLSDYVVQYRLASLKSAYYSLKLTVYLSLLEKRIKNRVSVIELIELVSVFIEDLYSSGLLNGERKNRLTSKYQLIEQSLTFLSDDHSPQGIINIDKLLRISRMGEFRVNKKIITSSKVHRPLITRLLHTLSPLESKIRNRADHDVSSLSKLLLKRNDLRERYLWLINDFYKSTHSNVKTQSMSAVNIPQVMYFEGVSKTFQYVKNGSKAYLKVIENHKLNKIVEPLNLLISGKPSYLKGRAEESEKVRALLSELWKLFDFPSIINSSNRLIIHKDGILNTVPFGALINDRGKYLIENQSIGYESALSNSEEYVEDLEFSVLSGEYKKVEMNIDYALKEARYLTSKFNTIWPERNEVLNSKSALHVVTHQVYNHLNEPALLLSEGDSIYTWDLFLLPNTPEIININSCASLRGYVVSGEGSRSFGYRAMEMGARQSLANLWNVEDANTYRISKDYLRRLSAGVSSMTSLQNSKKKFIKEADAYHQHPFFWSSLVHLGEDIKIKQNSYWILFLLILIPVVFSNMKLRISY